MLITEHTIPNTRNAPASRTTAHPSAQIKTTTANISKMMSKAGDRQSWLLLALVMLPVIGLIRNFMTYGFER